MSKMKIRPLPAGRFTAVVSIDGHACASTLPSRNRNAAARAASLLLGQICKTNVAAPGGRTVTPINGTATIPSRAHLPVAWNTGRGYTEAGQRIAAKAVEGGLIFVDVDRHINGFVARETVHRNDFQAVTMAAYDRCDYTWRKEISENEAELRAAAYAVASVDGRLKL